MSDDGREHGDFTASDGVKIHYISMGDEGSWVVLVHGYTGSAEGNWCANGVAAALAERHRVVAIDCRNHGRSDKPTPGGPGKPEDVVELMDHLGIERAHVHGYSMGGMITGRLLSLIPDRMITAAFGGSGIRETDEEWVARVPPDVDGTDPDEATASRNLRISAAMNNGLSRADAETTADAPREPRPPVTPERARRMGMGTGTLDLREIAIPVLAINGEFDRPLAKTHRMWRELRDFTSVVLPGKSHLTAIVPGYMPSEYLAVTVRFVDSNDG
ncbi:MAG: alpha/beta hydrolase [Acidimicrobiia bacterium]|nr:alpha/beta hydrolase [Acidimicrobiia bacterium]